MAGIDELPYRDPREALRQSVIGQPAAQATGIGAMPPNAGPQPQPMGAPNAGPRPQPMGAPGAGPQPQPMGAPNAGPQPQPGVRGALNRAIPSATLQVPGSGIGGAVARGAKATLGTLGKASPLLSTVAEVPMTTRDVLTPGMTGMDQAARVAEGVGRVGAAGVGALAGGAVAGPIGAIAGGGIGYFAPDAAMKVYNWATGNDAQLASKKAEELRNPQAAASGQVPLPAGVAPSTAGAGRGGTTETDPRVIGKPGATPAATSDGSVNFDPKAKSFSGTDVREGFDYAGGVRPAGLTPEQGGGGLKGGGTVTSLDTSEGFRQDQMEAQRLVAERLDREAQAPGATGIAGTTMSQDLRAKTDAMTPKDILRAATQYGSRAAGAAVQAQQVQQQSEAASRNAEVSTRAQDIGAMSQQAGNRAQRDIAAMQGRTQRDVANISSEGRIAAVEAKGAQPNKFTTVLLPDQIDPATGQVIRGGQAIVNSQTNEVTYPGQGTGAKPAAPPAGAIQKLRSDPKLAADFDAKYGKGAAAAALGQ